MNKKSLKNFCSINMGQSPKSTSYNQDGNGLPFYQGNADFGKMHPKTRFYCDSPIKIANKNDILISVRAPIGALNIALNKCCIGRGLAALTPMSNCNMYYLFYALSSSIDKLQCLGTGSTFKAITKSTLENLQIPYRQNDEQIKIANIFLKLDTLIQKRNIQLEKLDQLVLSRFIELFGDPYINTFGWNKQKLSHHLDVIGGYAFKSKEFKKVGIPVLRIGNINSGRFLPVNMVYWDNDINLEKYKIYSGDLVISLTGTVGKNDYGNVCIVGNDYPIYYLNQRNAKLILKDSLNKYYLSELLKFPKIKQQLTGISRGIRQANIANRDILNLQVPIPPIEIQQKYSRVLVQINKSKVEIQKSLDKLEILKKSLMQQYFG